MDDDEVIAAHEDDFAQADAAASERRRPNRRGFWIMIVTVGLTGVLVVVEIFANRPLVNSIGRAEHDLTLVHERAVKIEDASGSYLDADAGALVLPGDTVTMISGDLVAKGPGQVSVYASADGWAAATEARPDACFYIAEDLHGDATRYGGGTVCSGEAAFKQAQDTAW
ncbi:MAG: hypothetical protein QOI81_2192 [Actinomycetota bacterium]|jgi:hypothetical protein|nr:hypothetical protein [Actinomycetota bacterium]